MSNKIARVREPVERILPRRLRLISGLELMQLGISRKSYRGPYLINQDACYVDFRRLKRAYRRLH